MATYSPCNILTVDVEDYFQVSGFETVVKREQWDSIPSRVESSTRLLLELFAEADVQGTFFVLGWIAARFPNLIQEIQDAGHELASHGYWHRLVYNQTPDEFRSDLQKSRRAIKAACGVDVTAYRAPSFSITENSMWALDVLAEEGFHIDSSIFPMRHDRYGVPDANPRIHERDTKLHPILEIPPSVWRSRLGAIPVGGGYFRLLPLSLTIKAMKEIRNAGSPAMLYLHPWEVDPEQPIVRNIRLKDQIRHRIGLKRCSKKLVHLLRTSHFKSIKQALASTTSDCPTLHG